MIRHDDDLYDRLWQLASVTGAPVDLADFDSEAMHRMLAMARIHGVLGMVLSKLQNLAGSCGKTLELAGRSWRGEIVQSMRVRRHAEHVLRTMGHVGIPALIFKGPDFADHLYADPHMRPTLDVDVLVPRDRWVDAALMLEATGHFEKPGQPDLFLPSGVLSERTWEFPSAGTKIEVDLHWSLVHFPFFRKQAAVDYWNLDWNWSSESGGQGQLTPASRLVIAVVHAVYHHQFERLIQLTDIQQACRHIKSEVDQRALCAVVERTGTRLAIDVALQIAARFLNDPDIERLRARILESPAKPRLLPAILFDDARRNLRTIRTHFLSPGRRRIREWLITQPMRPDPGWEFRPVAPASHAAARKAESLSIPPPSSAYASLSAVPAKPDRKT